MQKVKPTKPQIERIIRSCKNIESLMERCQKMLQQNALAIQALSDGNLTTPIPETMPVGNQDLAIMTALNDCANIGIHVIPRDWLGVLTGISPKSGMYRSALARVIRAGWVQKAGIGDVSLADSPSRPQNVSPVGLNAAVITRRITEIFKEKDAAILSALVNHPDEWVPRAVLFDNPQMSSNRARLSELREQGLLEFGPNQTVRITLLPIGQTIAHREAKA